MASEKSIDHTKLKRQISWATMQGQADRLINPRLINAFVLLCHRWFNLSIHKMYLVTRIPVLGMPARGLNFGFIERKCNILY